MATYLVVLFLSVRHLHKKQEQHETKQNAIATDVAVIKTQVLSALGVSQDVKEHDRTLVKHEGRIEDNTKDINAQHQKIRDQDKKIEKIEERYYSKH